MALSENAQPQCESAGVLPAHSNDDRKTDTWR